MQWYRYGTYIKDLPKFTRIMLNMELALQSLFGRYIMQCTDGLRPSNPPSPRIWARIRGRYWSAKIDDISLWPSNSNKTGWRWKRMFHHFYRKSLFRANTDVSSIFWAASVFIIPQILVLAMAPLLALFSLFTDVIKSTAHCANFMLQYKYKLHPPPPQAPPTASPVLYVCLIKHCWLCDLINRMSWYLGHPFKKRKNTK